MERVGIPAREILRVVPFGLLTVGKDLMEACAMLLIAGLLQYLSLTAAHVTPGQVEVASDGEIRVCLSS